MSAATNLILNSGYRIPQIGFGTFDAHPEKISHAVEVAIGTGYRHIDTAALYENEKEVGEGIRSGMKKHGVKREELFITAKLWCDKHAPDDVRKACEESLSKLGLDYVDLYLIHFPMSSQIKSGYVFNHADPNCLIYEDIKIEDTWKAMEELVPAGLAKSIGVSNFNKSQIDRLLKMCRIPPAVNQVEVNLHWLNTKLIDYCHSKNILIEGYAPFRSPGFMKKAGSKEKSLFEEPYVIEVAKMHNRTPAQVLLRHGIERDIVVLTKSVSEDRIKSNFQIMDFELSEEDMEKLNKVGITQRLSPMEAFEKHPEYPFADEY